MAVDPLRTMASLDPALIEQNDRGRESAFSAGALPSRYKLLMAMAMDSALGTPHGVRSLAQQAIDAGATKGELVEVARVAIYVGGAFSFYNLGRGLDGLFESGDCGACGDDSGV